MNGNDKDLLAYTTAQVAGSNKSGSLMQVVDAAFSKSSTTDHLVENG